MDDYCIKLQQKVDVSTAEELRAELAAGLASAGDIVVDCSESEAFGVAAAQLFVAMDKALQSSERRLTFTNTSQAFLEDLETLGLAVLIGG